MKNKKGKYLFFFLVVLMTGIVVFVVDWLRNRPANGDVRPQYVEPGKGMELADFLNSQEAAAVTQINYWVETEMHRLTATSEGSRAFLDILRESGYEKIDISQSDELRSMFLSEEVQVFEMLTDEKKYFLGVSRSESGCLSFGGNHYIAGREIRTELIHVGKITDGSTDSPDREKEEVGGERVSTLSEFFAGGGREEVREIACWSWGNLYKLTDDPQTIQWFVEKLDPDNLAGTDQWIEGGLPELSLVMVAKDKKYIFYINESYISMGGEPLADNGDVYRKIEEISDWELES